MTNDNQYYFNRVIPGDGCFYAVGTHSSVPENWQEPDTTRTIITRFHNDGSRDWTRFVSHDRLDPSIYQYQAVHGIAQEDGSLLVLASIDRFDQSSAAYIWLFTLDSNGCHENHPCDSFLVLDDALTYSDGDSMVVNPNHSYIYPNPVEDRLFLQKLQQFSEYSIFNNIGFNIDHGIISDASISVAHLPAGHYILRLTNKNLAIHEQYTFIKL